METTLKNRDQTENLACVSYAEEGSRLNVSNINIAVLQRDIKKSFVEV